MLSRCPVAWYVLPPEEPRLPEQTAAAAKPVSSTPNDDSAACPKTAAATTPALAPSLSAGHRLPADNRPPPPRNLDNLSGHVDSSDRRVHPRVTSGRAGCVGTSIDAPAHHHAEWRVAEERVTGRSSPSPQHMSCSAVHNARIPMANGAVVNGSSPLPGPRREADGGAPRGFENGRTRRKCVGGGDVNHDQVAERKSIAASEQKGGPGVRDPSVVVEDAKRLAQNFAVVRRSLSVQQLEDLDSVLRKTLGDVRGMKGGDRGGGGGEQVL